MRKRLAFYTLTSIVIFIGCFASAFAEPSESNWVLFQIPTEIHYTGQYKNLDITAIRRLSELEIDNTNATHDWQLKYTINHPMVGLQQTSTFSLFNHKRFRTHQYDYQFRFLGINKHETILTNLENKTALSQPNSSEHYQYAITGADTDKLTVLLQLQIDLKKLKTKHRLRYPVLNKKRLELNEFEWLGEEVIDTALGKLKTTKILRVREDKERETVYWLAEDFGNCPVKVVHKEQGNAWQIVASSISQETLDIRIKTKTPVENTTTQ